MEIRRATILGLTLFMGGLALCGIGLWLLLSPAQYRATARIEVYSFVSDTTGSGQLLYDPYFIQTECEIIQSEAILGKVVEALHLNVEWGKKYAGSATLATNQSIAILKRHLNLAIERNTRFVEISFTSPDQDEAAKVANAVAEANQDYQLEMRMQQAQKGIQILTEEFEKQERNIETKQKKLDALRNQLNVPNPEPSDDLLKSNYPAYIQARQEVQKLIDFQKLLRAKIEWEKMDLSIPKTQGATIIDLAKPPELPAGPNRPLGAALLAIGLFPTVGGFLMLKSARHPVRL